MTIVKAMVAPLNKLDTRSPNALLLTSNKTHDRFIKA